MKLLAVLALLGAVGGSPPPAALSISPRFGSSTPLKVKADIVIEESDLNRAACLFWDGTSGEAGSHCWEHLDTNDFPHRTSYNVILRSHGDFEFYLVLQRTDRTFQTPPVLVEIPE